MDTTTSNEAVAERCDVLILAVKPSQVESVVNQIAERKKESCVVVSVVAGVSLSQLERLFNKPVKVVRAMPNTPVGVGAGMTSLTPNEQVSESEVEEVCWLFNQFGRAEVVSEDLIDAVVGVSGSSPAFVFMLIEAMGDAAVANGMPRGMAYRFAAQAVYGSAKLVLESGEQPGELKDRVCSPGGTTIEGVAALEAHGFRNAVISASRACHDKSRDMGRKSEQ